MKNIFYLSILLFLPLLTWGQSQDKNYVLSRTYTKPTTGTITADDLITTVQYYDGLGRPIQRLDYKAGGNKQDIVTPIVYDQGGNTTKSYLPYANQPKVPNSLDYRDNTTLIPTIESLYYSKFPGDFTSSPLNPYSETFYDNSPLNRVVKQGAPGSEWRGNASNDNDHTIRKSYSSNQDKEVYRFKVIFTPSNTEDPELSIAGYYQGNELYKTVTKNENWTTLDGDNNTTQEFKDKEGRVVLTRTFNNYNPHDTYYVYDKYSNLTFVIPPVAADDIVQEPQPGTFYINTSVIDELCYIYRYDYRNRVVEKKIPGKGWEYMIYDKLNRVVLTQDEKTKKEENKWLFTKYDQFDRVVYTGTMINSASRSTLQGLVKNQSTWHESRSTTTFSGNGVSVYYTNQVYPKASDGTVYTVNTVNYYDDYSNFGAPTVSTVYDETVTTVTKSLPTISQVRVLDAADPNKFIFTRMGYDKKARLIYTYKNDGYLKYYDEIEIDLDFTGKVLTQKTNHLKQHSASWTSTTFIDYFTYDHMGRLLKHTQADWEYDTNLELISSNTYDDLGQLVQKKVGGKATASIPLQTLDYTYNIRGWLKAVNNPDMTLSGGDLFAFRVSYNQPSLSGSTALYNGNISETYWRSKTDNKMRSYSYKYDDLNRLTDANYTKQYGLVTNPSAIEDYTEGSIKYDKNGNITSLVRWGLFDDHGTDNIDKIDVLSYVYEPFSNRLRSVSDNGGTDEGFYNGSNTTVEYQYDMNGNMTVDKNKKIQSITYNYLNLPIRVVFDGGSNTIDYVYDATGKKLKKTVANSGNVTVTEYNGGFVYVKEGAGSNNLQYIPMAEGYITKGPYVGGESFKYVYQFKDHLGNIRLTYTDVDGNGAIASNEIIVETNYYAFGLQHKGYNANVNLNSNGNAVAQKWKYNDTELEEALGYNMYEMDFRQYDPALARWVVIDPIIHFNLSPYNAFDNNPVFWADPSGADVDFYSNGMYADGADAGAFYAALLQAMDTGSANFTATNVNDFTFSELLPEIEVEGRWITQGPNAGDVGFNLKPYVKNHVYTNSKFYQEWRDQKMMEAHHDMLDLIGFVDPTGIADGLNGVLYASEGNYTMAAMSMAAVLPLGDLVKGVKFVGGKKGAYSVYHGLNDLGEVAYVGITKRNPTVRFGEHLNSIGTGKEFLRYDVIEGSLTKTEARIIEQKIINQYGLQKNGGQLLNKINSIAPKYWAQYGL